MIICRPFPTASLLRAGAAILLTGFACRGGELVRLKSDFTLTAKSHTVSGSTTILTLASGTLELPSSEIAGIEFLPDSPQASPAAAAIPKMVDVEALLRAAAANEGLPPQFVRSVAEAESGLNRDAVSGKGAVGLMQLMPGTARDLGVKSAEPAENARGGARYLRELLIRYHGDSALALAAYNAGPQAVARYGGVPPYPETQHYVRRVLRQYARELASSGASGRTPGS